MNCAVLKFVDIVITAARLSASHAMARAVVLYIQYAAQLDRIGSLGHRVSNFGRRFSHCAVQHCVVTVSE